MITDLTTLRTGSPSLIPAYNNVSRNLFISDYNSFDGIDNDDGSSYYDISQNVFYLNEGLKSDYHGHGKLYHDNINIGAGVCCFQFGFITGRDACRGGRCAFEWDSLLTSPHPHPHLILS